MAGDTMRRRGFSLIELMVVVAVSAILIAAAVATFTAMLNQQRRSERTLDIYSSLRMGWGLIDFDVANAGFRFPSAAFSVRVVNNFTAGSLNLNGLNGGAGVIDATQNCGLPGWGIVPGTDVLELAEGYVPEASGLVQGVTGYTSFVLQGSTNPLSATAGNPIVMFSNAAGDACLAEVTSGAPLPGASISITMLAPDFSLEPSPATRYPNCPAADMRVYRLGRRTRYLVCQNLALPAARRHGVLFRQVAVDDGTASSPGAFGAFEQVQDGIADLQIGLRVHDLGMGVTGTNCVTTGTTQYCYCNTPTVPGAAAPCGGADQNGAVPDFNPPITDGKSHQQWVRGVVVGLTAVSARPAAVGPEASAPTFLRPALLDHAAAVGPGDGNIYLAGQHSVVLTNMTMVEP